MIIKENIHLSQLPEENFEPAQNLISVRPMPGSPQRVTLPQDQLPGWDATYKYAYQGRPKVDYERVNAIPEGGEDVASDAGDAYYGIKPKPVNGRKMTQADINFRKVTNEAYNPREDSEFTANTELINREFSVLPDLRPEGEYMMPSYELMAGLGTGFVTVPADMSFDQMERELDKMHDVSHSGTMGGLGQLRRRGRGMGSIIDTIKEFGESLKPITQAVKDNKDILLLFKKPDGTTVTAPASAPPAGGVPAGYYPPPSGLPGWAIPAMIGGGVLVLGGLFLLARR